jgi:cleavage stimulation factor subunit 2
MSNSHGVAKHDIFVGNILHSTTTDQLLEVFSQVGPVINIRIMSDKDTGKPKGFAFIEYMV